MPAKAGIHRVCSTHMDASLRWHDNSRRRLPAALGVFVLLIEPLRKRRKVLDDSPCIDFFAAREFLKRLLPRLALALLQHRPETLARVFTAIIAALVQRPLVASSVAQGLVELKHQDVGQEIPNIRCISRYMIFGARIKKV